MTEFVDKDIEETNAGQYRDFLVMSVPTIADVTIALEYAYGERYLMPFDAFRHNGSPDWWNAYTTLKHTEFNDFKQANLTNCLNVVGALMVLGRLLDYSMAMGPWGAIETKLSSRVYVVVGTPFGTGQDGIRRLLFGATTPSGTA